MRTAKIKTIFHIVGAACLIFGGLIILVAIDDGGTESTIALAIGLFMVTAAMYCLAGAPHLTKAIQRKFPDDGLRRQAPVNPRHKLKATIGIAVGLLLAAVPVLLFVPEFAGYAEWILLCGFLAPLFATWGAAHLSWRMGVSPMIPIVVSCIGIPVLVVVARLDQTLALVSYGLMTIAPILVVVLLQQGQHRRRSKRERLP